MTQSAPFDPNGRFQYHGLRGAEDAQRFSGLSQRVTGEGPICERLIHRRPGTRFEDFFVVEDSQTGEVVSTTCLLPWEIHYQGLTLKAAMLEMVVTDPEYRRHGLVRSQIQQFQSRVSQQAYDFSIIQGIPFYYRQYGYGYGLDQSRWVFLSADLAAASPARDKLRLRALQEEDLPTAASLYDRSRSKLDLFVRRDLADWRYLAFSTGFDWRVLEDEQKTVIGVFWLKREDDHLEVRESSLADGADPQEVLACLFREQKSALEIMGGPADRLFGAAAERGGRDETGDQWLIHIAHPHRLLARLAPVLQNRLNAAGLGGWSGDLTINFFRSALRLRFAPGLPPDSLEAGFVDSSMGADGGDLCIPPDAFNRLVFGYRGLDQLRDAWPDIRFRAEKKQLLEILFPPLTSLIQMPY